VVDAIESRQFQAPSLDKLKGKLADKKVTFATMQGFLVLLIGVM
jgi:hypothetical protein